jgi:hypothetical protein
VQKLADRAAARQERAAIGVVWSRRETVLPAGYEFEAGEHLAVDVWEEEPAGEAPASWRVVERIATDPGDYGRVHDAHGRQVGRVCSLSDGGHLLRIEYFEHAEGAATEGEPPEGADGGRAGEIGAARASAPPA